MSREDVARNQRARLLAAMVASVAERGYAGTRLSDLVERSGVARKSFYALFSDKEECFAAAVEAITAAVVKTAAGPAATWEEQVRGSATAFAGMVVAQPAAARMCLSEAYVVGGGALTQLEEATAHIEAHILAAARGAGMEGDELAAMIEALVGALTEIARRRLRLGREAELPELIGHFTDLALSYRPPARSLRPTGRAPAPAPEGSEAYGHVDRVLQAFASVVAERGYRSTTIELVLRRASMSPTTFYANFASLEEVLSATIETAGLQLMAAILPGFHRNPEWTHGVRAAFGDFFDFLAWRPALARVLLVEVYAAGPTALERRDEALRPLELLLAEGRARGQRLPAPAIEMIAGGVYRLAYRRVRETGAGSLPGLAPLCAYLTLAPLVGAEEATAVAAGDGRPRAAGPEGRERLALSRVGLILNEGKASAEMISREIGVPAEAVRRRLGYLERAGLIVAVEGSVEGGPTEVFYRPDTDIVDEERWALMDAAERQAISRQVADLTIAEIDQAIELGTFDARVDRHLSRMPLLVDEQGWRELVALQERTFRASARIQAESAERLERSRRRGIPASNVQALFEVPRPPF